MRLAKRCRLVGVPKRALRMGHGRWNGCIDPAGPEGADGPAQAGHTVGMASPNAQCCAGSLR